MIVNADKVGVSSFPMVGHHVGLIFLNRKTNHEKNEKSFI